MAYRHRQREIQTDTETNTQRQTTCHCAVFTDINNVQLRVNKQRTQVTFARQA